MNCLSPYSIVVLQLLVIVSSSTKCSLEVPFEVKEQRVRFDNISPDQNYCIANPPKTPFTLICAIAIANDFC